MRIRSTKPEFWKSARIATVPWDARLVLKGLESYVDDNGVGKDDIALIVSDVFPRDMLANPRETVARVSEAISHLHQANLVHRYEADGTSLLFISWWDEAQRIDKATKGRFPRPDGTMNYKSSVIRGTLARIPEVLAPGTGEQGNRGTGEQAAVTRESATANSGGEDEVPLPPEPDDDWAGEADVIPLEAPRHVETGTRPRKAQPTQAARTLVRQVIPGLTREVTDQLANHVAQAARDGTPDTAMRTGLERWRDDPDRPKPGALPYRIGDAARDLAANPNANPARPSKQRGMAEMLARARAEEAHQKAAGELE